MNPLTKIPLFSTGNPMTSNSKKLLGILILSASLFSTAYASKGPAVELTMDPDINQAIFASPEIAAQAFTKAISDKSKDQIGKILGLNATQLLPLANIKQEKIEEYLKAYSQSHALKAEGEKQSVLAVGKDGWTLPIPIIKGDNGWYFDSDEGINRIRIRRIGRNELAVMQVVLAYHDAQMEYAAKDRNGNGKLEYAQKFISTANKHDGLYWETSEPEVLSPLGSLFANDTPEGAYHGYYYRILNSQGDAAKGGREDYVIDGQMTGGFALIAWPAVYGRTGVMSFMVSDHGVVYQQDLGQDSAGLAMEIPAFNPGAGWLPLQ